MGRNAQRFNCATCIWGRHCDASNPAPVKQFVIRAMGVELESDVCFLPMITPQSRFLLDMHRHYKNGYLPYGGGLLEQPAYFLEAMSLIETIVNEAQQPTSDGKEQGRNHRSRPHR